MKPSELLLHAAPVMPVANFNSLTHAQACSELFAEAGVPAIEVTLRSPDAWRYFDICKKVMSDAQVGVGTVTSAAQLQTAVDEADFAISPGFAPDLLDVLPDNYCYIPGVATASEIMQAAARGFSTLKLFPASIVGGVAALKAFSGPFPSIRFCPTGGITASNMQDYLALSNVLCIGGSWLVPSEKQLQANRPKLLAELKSLYAK